MAQLLVRNVSQDVVEALKRRAAEHGRSAEAEHRLILEATLCAAETAFGSARPSCEKSCAVEFPVIPRI